jgi:uncharacterized protein (TIGR03435 family)
VKLLPLLIATAALSAQTRPVFEVASIKPATECNGARGLRGASPGRLNLTCMSVRSLIQAAYGAFAGEALTARMMQVLGGPGWLDSDRYDITAKAEDSASIPRMMGPMLQTLLEERFQLKVHKEGRETAVYALTVVKGGPKIQEAREGSCIPIDMSKPPEFKPGQAPPRMCGGGSMRGTPAGNSAEWYSVTMDEFAGRMLSGQVDRPVIDKTGLTGRYDIKIAYTRELPPIVQLNGESMPSPPPSSPDAGPTIFTALQEQLGLKLSPEKGSVEVLVVDSAAKPSGN